MEQTPFAFAKEADGLCFGKFIHANLLIDHLLLLGFFSSGFCFGNRLGEVTSLFQAT